MSAKNTIRSYCTPDWSSAIAISFPYTAPADGWIFGAAQYNYGDIYTYVNGVIVTNTAGTTGWESRGNMSFLVSKNDVITINPTPSGYRFLNFVPCKGVN